MGKRILAVIAAAVALGFAACGEGSVAAGAEESIEGDLAERIGLGELTAECDEPEERAEGETFECTEMRPTWFVECQQFFY